ncbi:MAG: response regulator [Candidatus Cloacimonas sp.]
MKMQVLIIEDNPENMYLMRYLLENQGYEVEGVTSGPEGIEILERIKPDAILLDIQLPGMDGYEVARELRKNPEINSIPIIAVTSYAMVGDKEQALAAGADAYIEKPINPDTFVAEIEKYLIKI